MAFSRGDYSGLSRWEAGLRAMFKGRSVYDPATVDLTGADGKPLDLRRAFSPAEPIEELRGFFQKTGFLLVKGLFSTEEIQTLRDEVEQAAAQAVPGDRHSWWAKNATSDDLLTRLLYLGEKSPAIAKLEHDPRLRKLAGLGEEPVVAVGNRLDSPAAVLKVPGVVSGLADYPWHVDCGSDCIRFCAPA